MVSEKYQRLLSILSELKNVAVAFSGGVDSTFLLYAAQKALSDKAMAITARSVLFPNRELDEAIAFTKQYQIMHLIFDADILSVEGFCQNPINRCYLCKHSLFTQMMAIASEYGCHVVDGSNVDDLNVFRPGSKAVAELHIPSPLREAGLRKDEIRKLSQVMSLPTWDKPSFACLASRFSYGETITKEGLTAVSEAEALLFSLGFKQIRVRVHGKLARIETPPDEIKRFLQDEIRLTVHTALKDMGFTHVSLDLLGYRFGSMDEGISAT